MPNGKASPEIMDAVSKDREVELLDAVVTCAALVSHGDGCGDPVERLRLLDFLDRNELLLLFTNEHVRGSFERRVSDLREPGGADVALARIKRHTGQAPFRQVAAVGKAGTSAEGSVDARELRALHLIQASLGKRHSPGASSRLPMK
jgi:tellurite resistance protein